MGLGVGLRRGTVGLTGGTQAAGVGSKNAKTRILKTSGTPVEQLEVGKVGLPPLFVTNQ
jgi:hypothetical protein